VPYLGICHNSSHVAALTRRLQSNIFGLLPDGRLPFYYSALAELLSVEHGQSQVQGAGEGFVTAKAGTAKAKTGRAKAKTGRAKAKTSAAMGRALEAAKGHDVIEVGDDEENIDQDDDDGGLSESEPDSPGV